VVAPVVDAGSDAAEDAGVADAGADADAGEVAVAGPPKKKNPRSDVVVPPWLRH
jgi:hypothetical protein